MGRPASATTLVPRAIPVIPPDSSSGCFAASVQQVEIGQERPFGTSARSGSWRGRLFGSADCAGVSSLENCTDIGSLN